MITGTVTFHRYWRTTTIHLHTFDIGISNWPLRNLKVGGPKHISPTVRKLYYTTHSRVELYIPSFILQSIQRVHSLTAFTNLHSIHNLSYIHSRSACDPSPQCPFQISPHPTRYVLIPHPPTTSPTSPPTSLTDIPFLTQLPSYAAHRSAWTIHRLR